MIGIFFLDGRRYSGSAATPASLQTQQHQRPAVQSSTFFSSHPKVQNDGNGQHSSLNVGSQKIHQSLSRPNPQSYHLSPQQQSQQYDHSQRLSEFESEDSQPSTSTILPLEDKVPKGDSPQSSATNDDSGHKQSSSGSRQKAMSNSSGSDGRGYAMTAENSGGHLRFPGGGGSIRNDGTDDSFYSAIPETHSSKGRPQGSSNLDHQYSPEFQMSVPGLNSLQENNKDSSATSIVDDSPYGDRHTMDNPET